MELNEAQLEIIRINSEIAQFWGNGAPGWAPPEAEGLLSSSRLDRQASISHSLQRWLDSQELSDGDLILAWTTLGILVEGTLKTFLGVFQTDWLADPLSKDKYDRARRSDKIMMGDLIEYFEAASLLDATDLGFVRNIQSKRNAVHAFRDRNIGTTNDFQNAVIQYCAFLKYMNSRLPYPSGFEVRSNLYDSNHPNIIGKVIIDHAYTSETPILASIVNGKNGSFKLIQNGIEISHHDLIKAKPIEP